MTVDISTLTVNEGDLIVLIGDMESEDEWEIFANTLHEHFPKSLVLFLPEGSTIGAFPLDDLKKVIFEHEESLKS